MPKKPDFSIFNEPHMRQSSPPPPNGGEEGTPQPPEKQADDKRYEDMSDYSVWDEPTLSSELGVSIDSRKEHGFAKKMELRRSETSAGFSWTITFLIALAAGPWAVIGAFWQGYGGGLLAIIIFGPTIEEVMKIAAAALIAEEKPWLFRSGFQIAICALAGGMVFAIIENLLYLHVYIPDPSPGLIRWRWTVCVALHMGCTFVAGIGIIRVWRDAWKNRTRPNISLAFPYLVAAILIHTLYNTFAVALAMMKVEI